MGAEPAVEDEKGIMDKLRELKDLDAPRCGDAPYNDGDYGYSSETLEKCVIGKWDDGGNGCNITCKQARGHDIAPVDSTHLAYKFMRDGDGDGMICVK